MNKQKLKNYNLNASIHTFAIKSKGQPQVPHTSNNDIIRCAYMPKTDMWHTRINPNKINDELMSYSEFMATFNQIACSLKISEPIFYRTDIRLDSYIDNFQEYYKLNLLLISLFSIIFNDSNGQAIGHMLTQTKEFSDISSQNQYWEIKYYNKKFQTNDSDVAKARLEFRSLKSTNVNGHPPHEIKKMWFKKLDTLPALYGDLQRECNKNLYNAYIDYCNYNNKSMTKGDLATKFFNDYAHSMTVFTRHQLKEFLLMCGINKDRVEERADYIYRKTNIEFFSKTDLEIYISKIKTAMNNFFEY